MVRTIWLVAFCLAACKGDHPAASSAPPPPARPSASHGVLTEAAIAGYIAVIRDGDRNPYDAIRDPKTGRIGNRSNIEHDYGSLDPFVAKHGFANSAGYSRAVGTIMAGELALRTGGVSKVDAADLALIAEHLEELAAAEKAKRDRELAATPGP